MSDLPEGTVQVPYEVRDFFRAFHERETRFAVMVAHRRAGKTVACVNELINRAIHFKKKDAKGKLLLRPRYAYIGPLLKQAKKTAWEYLKYYTAGLEKKKPSESELSIVLKHNNAEIGIYGADNPDSFRGQYFDGIVLDEYGDMSPSVWGSNLLPTLADRKGWAAFIGTFKGRNHFYRVYRNAQGLDLRSDVDRDEYTKNWFHYIFSIEGSTALTEEEKRLQKAEMTDEEWEQEFLCNPDATVKGTYYMKQITELEKAGQIYSSMAEYDPDQMVEVATDLGYTDSTAMWFWQRRPGGLAIIDYVEAHSQPMSYYFDILNQKPYNYKLVWLPHDARAHSFQTGRSTIEQFLHAGFPCRLVPKLDIQDGIAAARKVLPMCYFHTSTSQGVEALRAYHRDYNEDTKAFSDNPFHDWSSHGADAFRYLALVAKEVLVDNSPPRIEIPSPKLQLEVLFDQRERFLRSVRRRM